MSSIFALQLGAALLLGVLALGLELYALIDALRQPPAAYLAAGKRTKGLWVGITVAASLVGFVSVNNPIVICGSKRRSLEHPRGRRGSGLPHRRAPGAASGAWPGRVERAIRAVVTVWLS